jgi:Amt family ammonium transporter
LNPTAATPPSLDSSSAICVLLILLIPLAAAGIALINTGLGRSRNAAHMMLTSLCAMGVAAIVYFAVGFSWQGYLGTAAHVLMIAGKPLDWIATAPFFLRGMPLDGSRASLIALFGMFSVALVAILPLGSGADRWKLSSACISSAILAGFTYPLFAHWAWNGWLAQLGTNYGIGQGFLDSGGAASIQVLGGLTALAVTWVLGPRRGKYTPDRMPLAIPGHQGVYVLFGCFLAWIGWIGLDGAGTILFTSAGSGTVVLVAINATLGALAAALAAAVVTRARYGKPDASLCANGWIAGLVASSAGCAYFRPLAALIIGFIAGALVTYSVEMLELHFTIDDPGGTISVHAVGGIWGILAAGWFTTLPVEENAAAAVARGLTQASQWIAQVAAVATLLGFVLPFSYGIYRLLTRIRPMRVRAEGERKGLDLEELGAGAYPDFMSHNDDLLQR